MTQLPHSQWPKPYLLTILKRAVDEGCIRLGPKGLDAEKAKSLIGALNRIRRRSDKQHASFILPEYHLVTTTWEPARGTLLVIYSSLPDGMEVPDIRSIPAEDKQQLEVPEAAAPLALELPTSSASGPAQGEAPDIDALLTELVEREALRQA